MNQEEITFRFGAHESDAPAIEKIMRSSGFFEEVSDEIDGAIEDLIDASRHNIGTYIFAELNGKVVGYVSYDTLVCTDAAMMFEWIAVDNSLRGKGIGAKLMYKSFEEMRKAGKRKAFLYTSGRPQYLPTRKFYEKCGFKFEGEMKDYYVIGDPCYIYSIVL